MRSSPSDYKRNRPAHGGKCQQAGGYTHQRAGSQSNGCRHNVSVCEPQAVLGNIVSGVFTPVFAKHLKSFWLIDCISVCVNRMQRNIEPMRKQVEAWQKSELTDVTAKLVIYEAFVESQLEAPKHLARAVHDLYVVPSMTNSGLGRCGACRTLSHAPSRKSILSPNSKRQRSWESSWRLGSGRRSDLTGFRPPAAAFAERTDSDGFQVTAGIFKMNVTPRPGLFSTCMTPSCASTIRLHILRPNP